MNAPEFSVPAAFSVLSFQNPDRYVPPMRIRYFIPLMLSFACGAGAAEPDRESDKQALRELAAQYEAAINRGDLSSLGDSLLPEASAVFVTGDECRGLPAMQAFYDRVREQLGPGTSYTVKLVPDHTDFYGDVAIGHGLSDERVRFGSGKELSWQTKWTAVLKKTDGAWRTSRLHVSLNPFDNPVIAARSNVTGWSLLAGGILGGVVAGFLLGRRRRKP